MPAQTRHACITDADALARIYNEGIADRIATFEVEHRTASDIKTWLADPIPVIVVEKDGDVAAFARLSAYRDRACYDTIREFSVYVARSVRGQGLGLAVMQDLIVNARRAGITKLVSRIFVENTAGLTLCDRLGFRRVGIYEKHGKLDGQWCDCAIVELLLTEQD